MLLGSLTKYTFTSDLNCLTPSFNLSLVPPVTTPLGQFQSSVFEKKEENLCAGFTKCTYCLPPQQKLPSLHRMGNELVYGSKSKPEHHWDMGGKKQDLQLSMAAYQWFS